MKAVQVPTKPFEGQKAGTSGLRKKTTVFEQEHYVENFVQATLLAVGLDKLKGKTLVVGGDGRYYNGVMIQKILALCAGNGVSKVVTGINGLISTPAVSGLIREIGAAGGFILTASHNPGGPKNDCGIKYNVENGGPAPEGITASIFEQTKTISSYSIAQLENVDLGKVGVTQMDGFTVEVVDTTETYATLLKSIFDFDSIRALLKRDDFSFAFDGMHGVAGPYAKKIFHDELGAALDSLMNCTPSEDFNGGHPDPNLTYASELVQKLGLNRKGEAIDVGSDAVPSFGAACDGDADRNMILGKHFFVTPSDSLAVIAANASAIPFFKAGLKCVCRSMPTSMAADLVSKKLGLSMFEVPTGWKFFGNLMDSGVLGKTDYCPLICGEESFGTGSNHVREKDGIWAVLCWLSILAARNPDASQPLVSVEDIVKGHWKEYGRNYYCRYDYENVESERAGQVTARLTDYIELFNVKKDCSTFPLPDGYEIASCDEFEYHDPVDGSVSAHQGWRFMFSDGSRVVFRLSGTGSVGATIRVYIEKYDKNNTTETTARALSELVTFALDLSNMEGITGRKEPTVIT